MNQNTVETTEAEPPVAPPEPRAWEVRKRRVRQALEREPSDRTVVLVLIAVAGLSTLFRAALVTRVHAPTVFSDELGYARLAQSIGETGHLALFDHRSLSYSPLYSVVLAPIYALGASAPTAYLATKMVSAFLISLSVFPTYKIARFVLPRRLSVLAAGLMAIAPLMLYPSFTMSENLAYPMSLLGVWAMLAAVRSPGPRTDALLIGAILVASAARLQLVVLLPAALTACAIAPFYNRLPGESFGDSLKRAARRHGLLLGVVAAAAFVAAAASATGHDVLNAFGRYATVGRHGFPPFRLFFDVLGRHIASLALAVGVVPFVGSLVAAFVFIRKRYPPLGEVAFATVAASLTAWIVVEVAFDAATFDSPAGDVPRIHERFLIYVIPFFVIALLAAYDRSVANARLYLVAAAVTAALPLAIPFHTVINNTVSVDTFGLQPFSRVVNGGLAPAPHVTLAAISASAILGLLYTQVRTRLLSITLLVVIAFLAIWDLGWSRIESGSAFARSVLPEHTDWVDRAHPAGEVVLLTGRRGTTAALETAYANQSIARLYYLCEPQFGAEFGEQRATISRSGQLQGPSGRLRAAYVVGQARFGLRGRVVARNTAGHEVLVAPTNGLVKVSPAKRAALLSCSQPRKS